jgi:hypothetical protein
VNLGGPLRPKADIDIRCRLWAFHDANSSAVRLKANCPPSAVQSSSHCCSVPVRRILVGGVTHDPHVPSHTGMSGRRHSAMSALGQKQTFCAAKTMSALPPKADIGSALARVRYGPRADVLERQRSRNVPRPSWRSGLVTRRHCDADAFLRQLVPYPLEPLIVR